MTRRIFATAVQPTSRSGGKILRIDVPEAALSAGFVNEPVGTHTSRTLMLQELQALLASVGMDATYADYLTEAVESNAVRKATLSTRKKTFRHQEPATIGDRPM